MIPHRTRMTFLTLAVFAWVAISCSAQKTGSIGGEAPLLPNERQQGIEVGSPSSPPTIKAFPLLVTPLEGTIAFELRPTKGDELLVALRSLEASETSKTTLATKQWCAQNSLCILAAFPGMQAQIRLTVDADGKVLEAAVTLDNRTIPASVELLAENTNTTGVALLTPEQRRAECREKRGYAHVRRWLATLDTEHPEMCPGWTSSLDVEEMEYHTEQNTFALVPTVLNGEQRLLVTACTQGDQSAWCFSYVVNDQRIACSTPRLGEFAKDMLELVKWTCTHRAFDAPCVIVPLSPLVERAAQCRALPTP